MSDQQHSEPDEEPATDELEEPSTEKDPGQEPEAPSDEPEGATHQAAGIGVIGGPLTHIEDHASADGD